MASYCLTASRAARMSSNCEMSAPDTKAFSPAPENTIARIVSSCSACASSGGTACHMSTDSALCLAGLLNRMCSVGPSAQACTRSVGERQLPVVASVMPASIRAAHSAADAGLPARCTKVFRPPRRRGADLRVCSRACPSARPVLAVQASAAVEAAQDLLLGLVRLDGGVVGPLRRLLAAAVLFGLPQLGARVFGGLGIGVVQVRHASSIARGAQCRHRPAARLRVV